MLNLQQLPTKHSIFARVHVMAGIYIKYCCRSKQMQDTFTIQLFSQWVQILCIYFKICKISSISLAIWILNYIIINTHIFQIKNQAFVPIHVYQHPREMQVICLQSSLVFFQNLKQCQNTFTLMFLRGLDGPGHFQTVLISFGRKALYEDIGK